MARSSSITHHAILIGIDPYPKRPLKSGTRDVEDIKAQIETILKDAVSISMITASPNLGASPNPLLLTQQLPNWPTRDNIISALEGIISRAKAGDFVYIHFSGHGSRKPCNEEFSNEESTGDLALVLLSSEKQDQVTYIYGHELAAILKAMVDAELVITLVLDCCFSATVYRPKDREVRFFPYDASSEPCSASGPLEHMKQRVETYRDIDMRPNWLLDPDRYVILVACGPTEEAVGARYDGKNHGALSYFLCTAMKSVGLTTRHKDIYDFVRVKVQGAGLPQNPVLYGNANQGFFGKVDSSITDVTIPIIVKKDKTVVLQAGAAHGVSVDDQFLLMPLKSSSVDPRSPGCSLVAQVYRTRGLTSDLRLQDESLQVRTGWTATALTRLSLKRFPIMLAPDFPDREMLLLALQNKSLEVQALATENPSDFRVIVGKAGECQILDDSMTKVMGMSPLSLEPSNIGHIADVLEHLCRFSLVRELFAPHDPFHEIFSVTLSSHGEAFRANCPIELKDGAIVDLVTENHGRVPLYAFVYDLGPSWQVENACKAAYVVMVPQTRRPRRSMKMKVRIPPQLKDKGLLSCKDIIKVFVTAQPTSFSCLELPKLCERAEKQTSSRVDPEDDDLPESWAAMNFLITISRKPILNSHELV
ncbi:caspase domain-containing protein [Xylaria curta]|nr:caspase domain-containing protein [Xylaria curta]